MKKISKWELAAVLAVVALDRVSKHWVRSAGQGVLNHQGGFGVGEGPLLLAVLVLVLLSVVWGFIRTKPKRVERVGWLIIISSGFSNLIDRAVWGGVWDWIYYPYVDVVGNLADVFLGLGVLLVLTQSVRKPAGMLGVAGEGGLVK